MSSSAKMSSKADHCLCGLMHVRTGTICIASYCIVAGVLNFLLIPGSLLGPLLNVLIGIVTIYGVNKRRPNLLLPLLICCAIAMIFCFIAVFVCAIFTYAPQLFFPNKMDEDELYYKRMVATAAATFLVFAFLLNTWFWDTTHKCFKFLRQENAIYVQDLSERDLYMQKC
ncbi:hypothetical protein QR680_015496 [Steinernema hermaphroditum]|uniref:Uncharacterized protein n=1 Tax=Steinernema hermaphroditum TaxID=289476 RepID=A0AA39LKY1_9BILA|nr:hypothetical protein QR680_015496 [Steinernema hermaphroditum]